MAEKTKRYIRCFEAGIDGQGQCRAGPSERPIPFHWANENNVFGVSTDFEKEVVLEQGLCYKKHFAGSITAGGGQGGFTVRGYPNTQVVRQLATGQSEYEPSAYQVQ